MDSKLVDTILKDTKDFISKGSKELKFNDIALSLYALHSELNPVYKKYSVGPVDDWRQIPLMPISEFKNNEVKLTMSDRMPFPGVMFESSGTTQRDKSKHFLYDTEFYRASMYEGFKDWIVPSTDKSNLHSYRVVLLSKTLPHSSLYYMMSYLSEIYDYRGIREQWELLTDVEVVNELLGWLTDEKEHPVILFGTSLAFYDLMDTVKKGNLEFEGLTKGSKMIETGGWKGRDIQISPIDLTKEIQEFFGLDEFNCLREYAMSEMSSQTWHSGSEDEVMYSYPRHLGVRIVDPLSQKDVEPGESGMIGFIDLANVWSCPFILTEDMGHLKTFTGADWSLVLEGRAVNAPEKGCSLTYVEEAMDS